MLRQTPEQVFTRRIEDFRVFAARHKKDSNNSAAELSRSFGYFTTHPFARLNQKRMRGILESIHALSERPTRILDLACGAGLLTHALADMGHRVVGIDQDARELHWAKLFGQEHRAAGQFLLGDATHLDQSFANIEDTLGGRPTIVLMAYSLHHLPEVEKSLDQLIPWLPPHADLLINEENPRSPLFRAKHWLRGKIQNDTQEEWHRSAAEWNQLFAARGCSTQGDPKGYDLWGNFFEERWSLIWTLRKTAPPS